MVGKQKRLDGNLVETFSNLAPNCAQAFLTQFGARSAQALSTVFSWSLLVHTVLDKVPLKCPKML